MLYIHIMCGFSGKNSEEGSCTHGRWQADIAKAAIVARKALAALLDLGTVPPRGHRVGRRIFGT
jgi:hypothetical protein